MLEQVRDWLDKQREANSWTNVNHFQEDAVDNAWNRLNKRLIGWLVHCGPESEDALSKFEDKHFAAYKRWKKNAKVNTLKEIKAEKKVVHLFGTFLIP